MLKRRIKARGRPQIGQRLYFLTLNFGLAAALTLRHVFAMV